MLGMALALTSDIVPVWVNVFGLIALCRFLVSHMTAAMLILNLQVVLGFKIRISSRGRRDVQQRGSGTGWSVSNIVDSLTDKVCTESYSESLIPHY